MSRKHIILIILGVILLSIVVFVLRLKYLYDKVTFGFDLTGINLSSISFFGQQLQANVQAGIDFKVDNPTNVRLKLKNLSIEVYRQGRRLARVEQIPVFEIQRRRNNVIKAQITLFANRDLVDLIAAVNQGSEEDVKTYTRFTLLGIPLRIPYTYTLTKDDF